MPSNVTLATARTEVRALLDELTAAFWTDAQLNSWLNQGCSDIARRAEVLWEEQDVPTVPNVQTYPFPSNFLNCHRAIYCINPPIDSVGALTQPMEFREINSMDENWGMIEGLPAAWPVWFTIRGNSTVNFMLTMYPAPAAEGVMRIYYYRQAVQAVADTDLIDTMSGWEDIVYDYAVFKALRKARVAIWQEAYQLYEKNMLNLIEKTRNMTDQNNQITSGMGALPVYAYVSDDAW